MAQDNTQNDERWVFKQGDIVYVEDSHPDMRKYFPIGGVAVVMTRRNGYPPPHFDWWFPLLHLFFIDGHIGGGEIGQGCVRSATTTEIVQAAHNLRETLQEMTRN